MTQVNESMKTILKIAFPMFDDYIVLTAASFADYAHGIKDQKRKYTGENYIVHPIAVGKTLQELGYDIEVISAGLLHDVLEDTGFTRDIIKRKFGERVLSLVEMVTNVAPEHLTRKERFKINLDRLKESNIFGKNIRLADIKDNLSSFEHYSESYKKLYFSEKNTTITEALYDGDTRLLNDVRNIFIQANEQFTF